MVSRINIFALDGVPLVKPGDDLVEIIKDALIVSNSQLDISKDILDEVNKKIKKID